MKFRGNIPLYILAALTVLSVGASYVRFVVAQDYIVEYEGVCDPAAQSCFVGCNDDACTDTYYYTKMQKYAVDLFAQCGKDITDCSAANVCLPQDDQNCSITYCDPQTDGDACVALIGDATTSTTENTGL